MQAYMGLRSRCAAALTVRGSENACRQERSASNRAEFTVKIDILLFPITQTAELVFRSVNNRTTTAEQQCFIVLFALLWPYIACIGETFSLVKPPTFHSPP